MGNVFLCMGTQCYFRFCDRQFQSLEKTVNMNYIPAGIKAVYGKDLFPGLNWVKLINIILWVIKEEKQIKVIPLPISGKKDLIQPPSPGICIMNGRMKNG